MSEEDLGPIVEIRLLELPVQLWSRTQQHTDELIREFVLLGQQRRHDEAPLLPLPVRLGQLVEEVGGNYGSFSEEQETQLLAAVAAGEAAIDVTYRMPAAVGAAARHLGDLLSEVDEYCRRGEHLLTLETPPDLVAFREWYLEEFRRQIAGEPPTPWHG
jgi:hypothetical protein